MKMRLLPILFFGWIALMPQTATGQVGNAAPQEPLQSAVADINTSSTPDIGVGRIGQRQTREDTASETRIQPMARINNRIPNRVQSRLRNRIDRNYDPVANATSPFMIAEEQALSNPNR